MSAVSVFSTERIVPDNLIASEFSSSRGDLIYFTSFCIKRLFWDKYFKSSSSHYSATELKPLKVSRIVAGIISYSLSKIVVKMNRNFYF